VRSVFTFTAVLALAATVACGGGDGGLATATVVLTDERGSHEELTVELARTAEERSRGLMFREELPEDQGMLFVFPNDTMTGFWMKDTLISLSIAFIAADGVILDVQEMEPLSTVLHRSPSPYRYALEVNQGWFGRHGLGTGVRVELPEAVIAATSGD
jgi:hypothetical protein